MFPSEPKWRSVSKERSLIWRKINVSSSSFYCKSYTNLGEASIQEYLYAPVADLRGQSWSHECHLFRVSKWEGTCFSTSSVTESSSNRRTCLKMFFLRFWLVGGIWNSLARSLTSLLWVRQSFLEQSICWFLLLANYLSWPYDCWLSKAKNHSKNPVSQLIYF